MTGILVLGTELERQEAFTIAAGLGFIVEKGFEGRLTGTLIRQDVPGMYIDFHGPSYYSDLPSVKTEMELCYDTRLSPAQPPMSDILGSFEERIPGILVRQPYMFDPSPVEQLGSYISSIH